MDFCLAIKQKSCILALGAESEGNFSVFTKNKLHFSENFSDLSEEKNFHRFQFAISNYLKKNKLRPNIILTDLHPHYLTTFWGEKLAKKFQAKHIQVQHHHAHIFSAIGEKMVQTKNYTLKNAFGIAMDGTGYGANGEIWGGEVFKIHGNEVPVRIGHLENQILLGGDLAIREPARMLISILSKFLNKDEVFFHIKKFYTRNEFELLLSQLEKKFNCENSSSTGRVLDAVAVLLGFSGNKREYKHGPTLELEKNSTLPYADLKPIIKNGELLTTPLFAYLIKNKARDKKRLAATAQLYIAQGLFSLLPKNSKNIFIAGGLTNNKIVSSYLGTQGAFANKKNPRGDAGISVGQIIYFLLASKSAG